MRDMLLGAALILVGIEYARIRCQTVTYVTVACGDMDDYDGDDDRGVVLDPGKESREILGSYATWERFLVWTGYRVWFGKIRRTAYGIVHGRCADCHGLICGEGDYCWKCQRPLCCGCEYICRNCRGCEPSWCSDQENCAWIDPICTCKSGGLL